MPIMSRLDPEFAPGVALMPVMDLTDLEAARSALLLRMEQLRTRPNHRVTHTDHRAPGRDGNPEVPVRVFRPATTVEGPLPLLYWIPGGGYVLPSPDFADQWCETAVERHGCIAIGVEWRRAPEHPFPAAAEDCYAGLAWAIQNAVELGVDPTRVVVGGESSGGGSAAGLALLSRDRGEFAISHQMLIYPMLDDRNVTVSSHRVTDSNIWNRSCNEVAWRAYLGDTYGTDDVSPYAAPTRMKDLSNLPPTTMLTNDLDLFVDEDIDYARRLIEADVPTELHVYPGACHGFPNLGPTAQVTAQFEADRDAALRRAFMPK